VTINPEFGPPPYQPIDSRTGEPLADIWGVCLWMTERFRQRWAGRDGITTSARIVRIAEERRAC